MANQRVLGIDPGSLITGWGMLEFEGGRIHYLAHGCITTKGKHFHVRLKEIYEGLSEVIERYQPVSVSIEQVFVSKNPQSALKLGQARGVALIAALNAGLEVYEYTPTMIKQAVTGQGHAEKHQVMFMVKNLLRFSGEIEVDASDALAAAICHLLQPNLPGLIEATIQRGRGHRSRSRRKKNSNF